MTPSSTNPPKYAAPGEPVWEIARLFPDQGAWTEEAYLRLDTNRFVEFDRGTIEVLPSPTRTHQEVLGNLYDALKRFLDTNGGGRGWVVVVGPYALRVPAGKYRQADVMYLTAE